MGGVSPTCMLGGVTSFVRVVEHDGDELLMLSMLLTDLLKAVVARHRVRMQDRCKPTNMYSSKYVYRSDLAALGRRGGLIRSRKHSANKILETGASLLVTSALLVVTRSY